MTENRNSREVWNDSFSESSPAWYPDEQVVRFSSGYLRKRTGINSTKDILPSPPKVLDLGCGCGRHVVFFAENGMDVSGCDVSDVAISFATEWLKQRNLTAELTVSSLEQLPYSDEIFDVVVCQGVLDHVFADQCALAVQEVSRILKPGGLFFVSLISKDDCGWGKGHRVGDTDTWIISEGYEANAPQTFFDKDGIINLLRPRFELISISKVTVESLIGRSLIGSDKDYPTDSRFYVLGRKAP